jgi:hypothetical protein
MSKSDRLTKRTAEAEARGTSVVSAGRYINDIPAVDDPVYIQFRRLLPKVQRLQRVYHAAWARGEYYCDVWDKGGQARNAGRLHVTDATLQRFRAKGTHYKGIAWDAHDKAQRMHYGIAARFATVLGPRWDVRHHMQAWKWHCAMTDKTTGDAHDMHLWAYTLHWYAAEGMKPGHNK